MRTWLNRLLLTFLIALQVGSLYAQETVALGLNYPETGPYLVQGLDQLRAAEMAIEEINASGGILGHQVDLVRKDSRSEPDRTRANVAELIETYRVKMVFGGSSSAVAIAAGEECAKHQTLFFATLSYSTETTGEAANKYVFRECSDSHASASAMAEYMRGHFSGKTYFYITADYTWGRTTEAAMRAYTMTEDTESHKGVKTPFPDATDSDFRKALQLAELADPDVLVLVLFGANMSTAIRIADDMGFKDDCQIVVPNLTIGMAELGGAEVMQGVIGTLPWTWKLPYEHNFPRGVGFVETFSERYGRYPSTAGASAYTIVYEYKAAVERAGSFDTEAVISELEGHTYTLLKDRQTWRAWDHQSVQTVYVVKCNPPDIVNADKYNLDFFEIISSQSGTQAFIDRNEWNAVRKSAGKPTKLQVPPRP